MQRANKNKRVISPGCFSLRIIKNIGSINQVNIAKGKKFPVRVLSEVLHMGQNVSNYLQVLLLANLIVIKFLGKSVSDLQDV